MEGDRKVSGFSILWADRIIEIKVAIEQIPIKPMFQYPLGGSNN